MVTVVAMATIKRSKFLRNIVARDIFSYTPPSQQNSLVIPPDKVIYGRLYLADHGSQGFYWRMDLKNKNFNSTLPAYTAYHIAFVF